MKVNLSLGRKSRIEMLPLIDIVFLLLVVFIYTMLSMAVHRGLRVSLPESSVAGIEKQLVLSITVDDEPPTRRSYTHAIIFENGKEMMCVYRDRRIFEGRMRSCSRYLATVRRAIL